jgi:hypothetical protein
LFLWSKNSVFHETHTHFHLSCDVLLLDLSLAVFFGVVLIGVWIFPIDFCSSLSGDSFSRLSRNRLLISISRSSVFCPSVGQGRSRSECLLFLGFCFSLSAPAVRAVGFRSHLRSYSRHSGRPGCSSLIWSVRTLISPFQLLRA